MCSRDYDTVSLIQNILFHSSDRIAQEQVRKQPWTEMDDIGGVPQSLDLNLILTSKHKNIIPTRQYISE